MEQPWIAVKGFCTRNLAKKFTVSGLKVLVPRLQAA
jgi:hypothetical protein